MQYDFFLVLMPTVAPETVEATYKQLLEKEGYAVSDFQVLGKRALNYEIKKQRDGMFAQATLTATGKNPHTISTRLKLDNDVLRSLVLKRVEGGKKSKLKDQSSK